MQHILKTWHEPFSATWEGRKLFEVRTTADRTFQQGDLLLLREYDPETEVYSGREIAAVVSYVLHGGQYGLPDNLCVMGISETMNNRTINGVYIPFYRVKE